MRARLIIIRCVNSNQLQLILIRSRTWRYDVNRSNSRVVVSRSQSHTRHFVVLVTFDLYPYRLLTFPEIRTLVCVCVRACAYVAAVRARIFTPFEYQSVSRPRRGRRSFSVQRYICILVIFQSLYRILSLRACLRIPQYARYAACSRPHSIFRGAATAKELLAAPDDIDSVLIGSSVYARCPLIKLIN